MGAPLSLYGRPASTGVGNPMEDSLYTHRAVTRVSIDGGKSIATVMTVVGVVSGIETSGTSVLLHVGSSGIPPTVTDWIPGLTRARSILRDNCE